MREAMAVKSIIFQRHYRCGGENMLDVNNKYDSI